MNKGKVEIVDSGQGYIEILGVKYYTEAYMSSQIIKERRGRASNRPFDIS